MDEIKNTNTNKQNAHRIKIAITGGNGFIGSRVAKTLAAQGHEIKIIDLTGTNTPINITDKRALTQALQGCEAVYHLAAAHRDDIFPRSLYYDINAGGAQNIVDAARANNIQRIIFTSTFAVYGLDSGTPDETSPPAPFNDYGKSKLEGEKIFEAWAKEDPIHALTIVRPVVVFGEGNRGNVHTLINQIVQNKFVMIGNGKNKKSMAYVENVSDFLAHCLKERPGIKIYNYADKPDYDMNTLTDVIYKALHKKKPFLRLPYVIGLLAGLGFDLLSKITGKNFPVSVVRIQKFCADTTSNADALKTAGFKSRYTLSDGLQNMIAHDFLNKKEAP